MTNIIDFPKRNPPTRSQEEWSRFYKRTKNTIAKHGRSVLGVFGCGEDTGSLSFSYTIGNTPKGLPDLLVIGTSRGTYLDWLSQTMIERQRAFDNGEIISTHEKYRIKIIDASHVAHENYTIQAGQFYGSESYRVQQVILSDTEGRLPGDEGCEEPFASVPVLAAS